MSRPSTEPPFLDKANPSIWKALNAFALAIGKDAEAAGVSRETLEIMYVRISQLNGCAYCLDMHTTRALNAGASPKRIAQLAAWHDSDVFTPAERAALTIGETVTLLPAPDGRRAALAAAREVLGDEAFTVLEWAAISMNAYNRVSIVSEHPVRDDRPAPHPAAARAQSATTASAQPDAPATAQPGATAPAEPSAAATSATQPDAPAAPKPHPHPHPLEDKMSEEITVADAPDRGRYEILIDGAQVGFSAYRDTDTAGTAQRILHHTEISPEHGGKGLAATLTRETVAASVAAGKRVVPVCPYVKKWLEKNSEFAEHIDRVRPEHLQLLS